VSDSAPVSRGFKVFLVGVVLATFACTVALRAPYLRLEDSGGEGVPRTLRHIAIWDAVGLADTHFMMRTTGTAPADRFIADVGYLSDGNGHYYYVSFPPLFPLAPYFAFKLIGVEATPLSLRVFNLFLHALGTFAMFLLAKRATSASGERFAWIAGCGAAILYATAPILLWYQSNAYSTASLATPFFILAAYLGVRAVHDESPPRWVLPAFGLSVWAVAYTEWLGVTLAAIALVYGIARRRDRRSRRMALVAVSVVGVTMLGMVVQYSSIAGLSAFIAGISGKYAIRSGIAETSNYSILALEGWGLVVKRYYRAYQQFMLMTPLLVAPALVAAWRRRRRASLAVPETPPSPRPRLVASPLATALVLTGGAVALHHLLLFSHTVIHVFDMLKGASVLGLAFGAAIASLDRVVSSPKRAWLLPVALVLIAAVSTGGGMVLSYRRYFSVPSASTAVGTAIRDAEVPPDEIVFLRGGPLYAGSAVVFSAGRNVAWYTPEYARQLTRLSGADGGVLFEISADGERVEAVKRVGRDGEIVPGP
jgi:hypothetical protein